MAAALSVELCFQSNSPHEMDVLHQMSGDLVLTLNRLLHDSLYYFISFNELITDRLIAAALRRILLLL